MEIRSISTTKFSTTVLTEDKWTLLFNIKQIDTLSDEKYISQLGDRFIITKNRPDLEGG